MMRILLAATLLALATAVPTAVDASSGFEKCLFGNAGICVASDGGCIGIGLGLQGVGVCNNNGCVSGYVGFNQFGCSTIVLP